MAKVRALWDTAREISAKHIENEANRAFKIALVGEPEYTEPVFEALLGNAPTEQTREVARNFADQMTEPPVSGYQTTLLCDATHTPQALAYSLLDRLPQSLHLSAARHFPLLRRDVTEALIREAAKSNAELAMLSALPSVIPVAGWIFPAVGDTLVLTKNQLMLLMRIAAAHGERASWSSRLTDMMPVVGGAFGWRAIARELVGIVPGGVGIALKGAIAYSGTMVAGKGARNFYETGRVFTPREQRQALNQASQEAKEAVKALMGRITNRK